MDEGRVGMDEGRVGMDEGRAEEGTRFPHLDFYPLWRTQVVG